jgi:hypothetical protein
MKKQEETILKELFQQLKQDDECRATSFADTRAAAQARLELRSQPWRRWRFAVITTSLLFIVGIAGWWMLGTGSNMEPQQQSQGALPSPSVKPEPQATVAQAPEQTSAPAVQRPPRRRGVSSHTRTTNDEGVEVATQFYSLAEDDELVSLESGYVMRVEVPASTLIQFDLLVTLESLTQPVQADLVIGQDGLARAIRFLPADQFTKTQ